MTTKLQLVNNVLALIGEQPLLNTSGRLGLLTLNAIETALINVVQETRANVFESTLSINVTADDYLTAVSLPSAVQQVYDVSLRVSTGNAFGDNIISVPYAKRELLANTPAYSIVGSSLFLSPQFARPATLNLRVLTVPDLPALDSDTLTLPANILSVVSHAAASILALSYLDDPNQASLQQNLASQLGEKLKGQFGTTRGRTFNMGKSSNAGSFVSGGLTNTVLPNIQYAPLDSPNFLNIAYVASEQIATRPWVTALIASNLANYSTTATIASIYLTQANAASVYLTQANAASTYATQASTTASLALKANIASPALTGTPTAPTAAASTNSTQLATTAYVKSNQPRVFFNDNSTPGVSITFGSYLAITAVTITLAVGDRVLINGTVNATNSSATFARLDTRVSVSGSSGIPNTLESYQATNLPTQLSNSVAGGGQCTTAGTYTFTLEAKAGVNPSTLSTAGAAFHVLVVKP